MAANADVLARVEGSQAVVRRDLGDDDARVRLVSGGGAGHEPMHAGFVGAGMLDAAVPGAVFTSPSPGEILAATRAVGGSGGVLHVVKSYTGDILNFRMAAEFAGDEGIEVEAVVVDDDVAIAADSDTPRRGTGVTIVVEKMAGALAAEGAPLAQVRDLAQRVIDRGRSFGVALHDDQMELGVGIHGEPGRDPVPIEPAGAIASAMLDPILDELPGGRRPAGAAERPGRHAAAPAVGALRRRCRRARGSRADGRAQRGRRPDHVARATRRGAHGGGAGRRAHASVGRPGGRARVHAGIGSRVWAFS